MAQTEKKYCILPGRTPLKLQNLSGHSCIIGEAPRQIPDFFEAEAIYGGAVSEEQLEDLKKRLLGSTVPESALIPPPPQITGVGDQEPGNDGKGSSDGSPMPPVQSESAGTKTENKGKGKAREVKPADPPSGDLFKQDEIDANLKSAIIEMLNAGNPADFEEGGAPRCDALSARLGRDVTGQERDAAYAEVIK